MKVTAVFASTLNGMVVLSKMDRTEWTSREDKKYFKDLTMDVGVIIMGRKTHEAIGRALPGRLNIVLSRTLEPLRRNDELIYTRLGPLELLESLEAEGVREVCLIGGPETFASFLELDLIDELHLTFEPIIRKGIANLASRLDFDVSLKLRELKKLSDSTFVAIYKLDKGERRGSE